MQYLLLNTGNITKECGPVSMTFTIPMYNASKLQVSVCHNLLIPVISYLNFQQTPRS